MLLNSERPFKSIAIDETKQLLSIASGVILSQFLSVLMMTTDVIFLGHLGSQYLAASSLASSYSWVTGFICYGLSLGMDTLIPQAIGANNKKMVGQVLQTSLFVTTLATIPVGLLWYFGRDLLALWVKNNDELLDLFSLFNKLLLPGLLPLSIFTVLRNFCEMQQLVKPSLIVSLIGVVVNIFTNWIFIHLFGFVGAPIATSVSRCVLCILMFCYVYFSKIYVPFWGGWSIDSIRLKNVAMFLRFGVPGMLTTVLEVGGFEVTVLMCGVLGDVVISANAVAFQINVLMYQFGVGFSRAITTRCGMFLGEKNVYMSKLSSWIGIILTIIVLVFFNMVIFLCRNVIGYIFTNEVDVVQLAAKIFKLLVLCTTFDSLNMSLTGIFRGVGRPLVSSVGNLIGFWVISFPLCYYFGFVKNMGVFGFWWGLFTGLSFIIVVEVIYLFTLNWVKLAEEAEKRTRVEGVEEEIELQEDVRINNEETVNDEDSLVK